MDTPLKSGQVQLPGPPPGVTPQAWSRGSPRCPGKQPKLLPSHALYPCTVRPGCPDWSRAS